MLTFLRTVRDILCLIGLALLIKYGYDRFRPQPVAPEPKPVVLTTAEKALEYAKRGSNTIVDVVSSSLVKLGHVTKKAKFRTVSTQTTEKKRMKSRKELLTALSQQIETAQNHLQQDDMLSDHEKNQLAARLKELVSQIEHLEKQIAKGAPCMAGPAGASAKTIYERTIERKTLAAVNKTEMVLIDLVNATTEKQIATNSAITPIEGIAHNDELLGYLNS